MPDFNITSKSFKKLAQDYNGKIKKFNQSKGLSHNWRVMQTGTQAQQGICAGLSIAYLGLQAIPTATKLTSGSDVELEKGLMLYAERLAQVGGNYSEGIAGIDSALSKVGLTRKSTEIICGNPQKMAKETISSPTGRSFIILSNHACATNVNKTKNSYVFFDPNYGFVKFDSSLNYVLFIADFLNIGQYGKRRFNVVHV